MSPSSILGNVENGTLRNREANGKPGTGSCQRVQRVGGKCGVGDTRDVPGWKKRMRIHPGCLGLFLMHANLVTTRFLRMVSDPRIQNLMHHLGLP